MRIAPSSVQRLETLAPARGSRDGAITIPAIAADGSLYPIEKLEAHRRGILHLAVSVFVFSGDALLIQRRAAGKYHCPGLWANSCCSHPHWGETLTSAAERRLEEELGCSLPLTATATLDYEADVSGGLRECERVTIFRTFADRRTLIVRPDPAEVSEVCWMSPADLQDNARARPEAYAPWFRIYLARWEELRLTP